MSPSGFTRLAVTHAANLAADGFVAVGLAGSIFFTAPAEEARGPVLTYLLVTMLPFALVTPIIGPALDRFGRSRRLLVAAGSLLRAGLCLAMARHLHSLLLFPEASLALALSKGYLVAKGAMVPSIVPDTRLLVEANGRLALIGALCGLGGGALAAGLLVLSAPTVVLVAAALVNLLATAAALRLPRGAFGAVEYGGPAELDRVQARRAMTALRAGVGFFTFLVAFALKEAREPSWVFGVVFAASAVGGLAGSLVAPRLRRRTGEEVILIGSLLIPSAVAVLSARAQGRLATAALAGAMAVGATGGRLAFDSLLQRGGRARQGRAFARLEARFQLAWTAGAVIGVLVPISSRVGFLALAVLLGAAGLSLVGSTRRPRSGA